MIVLLTIAALGLVIGLVLGGLGGGGAVITVPALVYVVGQSGQEATTSSLVIVGVTAVVGSLSYVADRRIDWVTALVFSLVGLPAAWAGTYLNHLVDEDVLLLGFSALMILAAGAMIADQRSGRGKVEAADDGPQPGRTTGRRRAAPSPSGAGSLRSGSRPWPSTRGMAAAVLAAALVVGFLTGFFGVGGGFVIVPALLLVLRMPLERVVGTSLMVVALNSGTSLLSRTSSSHLDWTVILPFTLAAALATILGKKLADRLPVAQLKLSFAALLVVVAAYTAWQSGLSITDGGTGDASSHSEGHARPAVQPVT